MLVFLTNLLFVICTIFRVSYTLECRIEPGVVINWGMGKIRKKNKWEGFNKRKAGKNNKLTCFQGYVKTMKSILYMINKLKQEKQEPKINLKKNFF